jgi:serine/threonine protein kinase
VHATAIEK